MKIEDSGMPDEAYWNSLFDIGGIIEWLAGASKYPVVAEIGCGYGTFTVPVARHIAEKVYAFDIEQDMIDIAQKNVRSAGLNNVRFRCCDVYPEGTGLESGSVDLVLLFNILHFAERRKFLAEAARILSVGGVVAVMHWRKDMPTPRGPALEVRPDREQIIESAAGLGLRCDGGSVTLAPYHWGMRLIRE